MKIPNKLDILGATYSVIQQEELGDSGQCWLGKQIILIEKRQHPEQKEMTLLHEVIEALNYQLELELPHKTICALETGLYHVLKKNKLI